MSPIGWASECCGLVRRGVHPYGIGAVAVFLLAGAGMKATSAAQGHNEAVHSANTLRPLTGAFPSSMATSRGGRHALVQDAAPRLHPQGPLLDPLSFSVRHVDPLRFVTAGGDIRSCRPGPGGSALTGRTEGSAPTLCLYASSLTLRRRERASGQRGSSCSLVSTSPGLRPTVVSGARR